MLANAAPLVETSRAPDRARLERQIRLLGLLVQVALAMGALIDKVRRGHAVPCGGLADLAFELLIELRNRIGPAARLAATLKARLEVQLARAKAASDAPAIETDKPDRFDWRDWEAEETLESLMGPEFSRALLNRPVEELIGLDPAWVETAGGPAPAPDIQQAAVAALETLARQILADTGGPLIRARFEEPHRRRSAPVPVPAAASP